MTDYFEDASVFIPLEIRNSLELDYVTKQIEAFRHNQNLHNDYALLALHQLFMFSVYGLIYSCLRRDKELVQAVFTLASVQPVQKQQLMQISSPFTLSLINERTVFDLMPILGCDISSSPSALKTLVDNRNDLAHCNGSTCADFEESIQEYLIGFEDLHAKFVPVAQNHLVDIAGIDFAATLDSQQDALKTILSENYISQRMLELATPPVGKSGLTKKADKLLTNYLINTI